MAPVLFTAFFFFLAILELLFLILWDIIWRVGGEVVHCGHEYDLIFSINKPTNVKRSQIIGDVQSMFSKML